MPLDLQSVINSPLGVGFAYVMSRLLPPEPGYRLAEFLADRLAARRNSGIVRAVRSNQYVATGEKLASEELDEAVRKTFRHTSHCLFDLYHNIRNHQAMERLVEITPPVEAILERMQGTSEEGMVVVAPHLSNFDLVARLAARRGLQGLVLTFPQPGGGYRWQNRLREETGLEIVPAATQVLRRAVRWLQDGGMVLTGIDRPYPDSKYHPRFFGRPAPLPVLHAYLGLKARVPVVVAAAQTRPDGVYEVLASRPVVMKPHQDREQEIMSNAERLLELAEAFIRPVPHQWAMYYPVWPEVNV